MGVRVKRWGRLDVAMATALTIHDQGLCSGCGQPRHRAYTEDTLGVYEVHTVECNACGALENHGNQKRKAMPGEKPYVVDTESPRFTHP
jgi:ribosomal protein L37E